MSAWKMALLFWAAIFIILWLIGPLPERKLLTGNSCVEVINRVFAKRHEAPPTPAEKIDLKSCKRAWEREQE